MSHTFPPQRDPFALDVEAPRPGRGGPTARRRAAAWLMAAGLTCAAAAAVSWYCLLPGPDAAAAPAREAEPKRKALAKNIELETEGNKRRVILTATVCLREGQLEGLLTRKMTKEHEYPLAVDADAKLIHAALLAAGAKPGSPVQFEPRYTPATGSHIKITLRYEKDGRTVTVPAQQWVRNVKTRKDLDQDWVFGGSRFVPDPEDQQQTVYLAQHGDLVCVCNMDTAMLDLPVPSPKRFDDRFYEANTERIPPLGTRVEVILEPVPDRK
jgi:hypothetical protein